MKNHNFIFRILLPAAVMLSIAATHPDTAYSTTDSGIAENATGTETGSTDGDATETETGSTDDDATGTETGSTDGNTTDTESGSPKGEASFTAQLAATPESAELQFTYSGNDNVRYLVEISTDQENWAEATATVFEKSDSIVLTSLTAGTLYYVRITPYTSSKDNKKNGITSGAFSFVTEPVAVPSLVQNLGSTTTEMQLSWDASAGACRYKVQYALSNTVLYTIVYTDKPEITLTNLIPNNRYSVIVTPQLVSDSGFVAECATGCSAEGLCLAPGRLPAPKCTYYYQSKGTYSASFNTDEIPCAAKYEYEVYTANNKDGDSFVKSTIVANTSGNSAGTIRTPEFMKHRLFKVRVRAINYTSTKIAQYGEWSDWTYFSPQPDIIRSKMKCVKSGIKLQWDKIEGITRYAVYVSTKSKSGYKLYKTTKKTSITVKKNNKKKLKKNKTYYFYVVPQIYLNGKWENIEAGNATLRWSKTYRR